MCTACSALEFPYEKLHRAADQGLPWCLESGGESWTKDVRNAGHLVQSIGQLCATGSNQRRLVLYQRLLKVN